jgi:hypothetical protein
MYQIFEFAALFLHIHQIRTDSFCALSNYANFHFATQQMSAVKICSNVYLTIVLREAAQFHSALLDEKHSFTVRTWLVCQKNPIKERK